MRFGAFIAAAGFAAAALPMLALAAEPDDGFCRNGLFAKEPGIALATVAGRGPVHFLDDMSGCPAAGSRCEKRAYVAPGDKVLTSRTRGAFICAYFPGRGGGAAGWVLRDRLQTLPMPPAPLRDWVGDWSYGDDRITLRRRGEALAADGEAYWPSADPTLPYGPHTGEFSGVARPVDQVLTVSDGDPDGCRVQMRRIGPWLIATDNGNCGGANVRFMGVYARRR